MLHKHQNENLQHDYLVAEREQREKLVERYIDASYEWNYGGFD